MLSKDPNESRPQTSNNPGTAKAPVPADPRFPLEVSSGGNGTVNDPSATDTKPPGIDIGGLDLLV
jgi:hypothetical protein